MPPRCQVPDGVCCGSPGTYTILVIWISPRLRRHNFVGLDGDVTFELAGSMTSGRSISADHQCRDVQRHDPARSGHGGDRQFHLHGDKRQGFV